MCATICGKGIVFHHDKDRHHTATKQKLRELRWETLMHPL